MGRAPSDLSPYPGGHSPGGGPSGGNPPARRLLAKLRDLHAHGAAPLSDLVRLVASEVVSEVCSVYVRRPGDLLELAGVEHVVGSESQAQTGEPHALVYSLYGVEETLNRLWHRYAGEDHA